MNRDDITHELLYPHSIDLVWRALTSSEWLASWLMPNTFVPKIGHRFTFETGPQAQWSGTISCEVTELEPPTRLAYTWTSGENFPLTVVTYTLKSVPEGTLLRMVHAGFAAGERPAWIARERMDSGWGSTILRVRLPRLLDEMAQQAITSGGIR